MTATRIKIQHSFLGDNSFRQITLERAWSRVDEVDLYKTHAGSLFPLFLLAHAHASPVLDTRVVVGDACSRDVGHAILDQVDLVHAR